MSGQRDEAPTTTSSATEKAEPRPARGGVQAEPSLPTATAGRRRFRYTLPGAWVALAFACLAFTPSLLPRSALLQGVVCGISAAIGYGLGVAGAWVWRAFTDRHPRPVRPGAWRFFAIAAAVLLVVAIVLGQWWQAQLRDLMGAPTPNLLTFMLLPLVAVAVSTGLVALSRSLRGLYHRFAGRLQRWMGPRAAHGFQPGLVAARGQLGQHPLHRQLVEQLGGGERLVAGHRQLPGAVGVRTRGRRTRTRRPPKVT